MSNLTKKFTRNKIIGIGLVAAIIVGVLGYASYNVFRQQDQARASFSTTDCVALEMQPGATCGFRITYTNGEGSPTTNSVLNVLIGSELVVDTTSFTDEMIVNGVSGGVFPMDYSAISQTNTSGWGARLLYRPGSANTTGTPSGSSTAGNLAASTTGTILFRASIRADVLTRYAVGAVLEPPTPLNFTSIQGIYSVLATTETPNPTPGLVRITLLAPDVVSSSSVTSSSVASSSASSNIGLGTYSSGDLTGPIGSQATGTIVLTGNTYTGPAIYQNGANCNISGNITNSIFAPTPGELIDPDCPTGALTTGQIAVGTTSSPSIPTNFTGGSSSASSSSNIGLGTTNGGGLTGTIGSPVGGTIPLVNNTYTGPATYQNGANCSINGTITNSVFTPTSGEIIDPGCPAGASTTGVIAVGGTTTPGANTNFAGNSSASSSSSAVATGSCGDRFGNDCRLYFTGANNTAVTWDANTQFNTSWDRAQKFKDGTATVVFDNIRKSNGAQIANGSACNFEMIRYGDTPVLRTLAGSTTAGGLTQASFVVGDQTVNYYTVIATCTETGTNEIVKDYDRLVLIVGAQGNRTGPEITL
jgi:hypothetical protein